MTAQDRLMLMIGQLFAQIAQLQVELEAARAALAAKEGPSDDAV